MLGRCLSREAHPVHEMASNAEDTVLCIPVRPKVSVQHHEPADIALIPMKTRGV